MKKILMLGHIGLGDHFLTNRIVRHISENNKITFFCFKKYDIVLSNKKVMHIIGIKKYKVLTTNNLIN